MGFILSNILLSYLIGSIPFGLILTKLFLKQDIRTIGSGNIGATNVLRTGKKMLAIATLLLDILKAVAVIVLASIAWGFENAYVPGELLFENKLTFITFCGLIAIIGHCFPVWLKFKGGKGVATAAGVLLAAVPYAGLAACVTWIATAAITRISSLSALLATLIAPIVTYFIYGTTPALICLIIAALVIWRHTDNIKRLMKGEEKPFGSKKDKKADAPVSK